METARSELNSPIRANAPRYEDCYRPRMAIRTAVGPWCWSLLTAAGLSPLACGGESGSVDESAGSDGVGESGTGPIAGSAGESSGRGGTSAGKGGGTSAGGSDGAGFAGVGAIRGEGGADETGGAGGAGATSGAGGAGATSGEGGAIARSGAGGAGGEEPITPRYPCENPVPVGGEGSGVFRCDRGMLHRASIETCHVTLGADPGPSSEPAADDCAVHADCDERPYGRCFLSELDSNVCEYGCATDADCATGESCLCGERIGQCVPRLDCQSDADCETGYHCAYLPAGKESEVEDECWYALACQRSDDSCGPGDTCQGDCGRFEMLDDPELANRSTCQQLSCPVAGRPFLVAGEARVAPHRHHGDFKLELALVDDEVDPALRVYLTRYWSDTAAAEHASIAAFARFALSLLALGAPPELLIGTARAMEDETYHAKICYALASHYAKRDVGPGPLAVDGALDACTLEQAAVSTVVEGCVGETLAALEAVEAAAHVTNAALRALLERIADDEARHAALAYRFVRWAIERGGEPVARAVRAAFDAALQARPAETGAKEPSQAELLARGVLPAAHRLELRLVALRAAIAPSADALLAATPMTRAAGQVASA